MREETRRSTTAQEEIEGLRQLTAGQLKDKYPEVFGEECRSNHKQFLFRRIAWRIQANVGAASPNAPAVERWRSPTTPTSASARRRTF